MKAFVIIALSVLFLISNETHSQGIKIIGKIENSKNNFLVFRKTGANVLTGQREDTRYKSTIGKNGDFEILLPSLEINKWIIEVDDVIRFVDLGWKTNFKVNISANDNYDVKVYDEFGNDFNFCNAVNKIVLDKFRYEKLQQLNSLDALIFRKEKAEFQLSLLNDYQKSHQMDKDYLKWLEINYQYEPYERSLVEDRIKPDSLTLLLLTEKGINNDFAAENSEYYNTLMEYYIHYKLNKLSFPFKIAQVFDCGIKNLSGLTKQVYLTRQMITLSKSPDHIYQPVYVKYKNEVTAERLLSLVRNERNKYASALTESNQSTENISKHTSLSEIFKKYKGKVIYADFWASWCGPCKSEMPNATKLREKLKGKEVVFVYFGYKDSKENWLAARKELNIIGAHYLLNNKLITEANSVFRITGIPHYVIIDKDGSILEKHAARPTNVYQQLLELAEKKLKRNE